MMNVSGIQPAVPPKAVGSVGSIDAVASKPQAQKATDVVEISAVAKLAAKVQELPAVRTDLVERVKAEIVAGTYETSERLEITIDRLMEELFPGF